MTAPSISAINIPPQQISYPGKVKIVVTWDQPIYNLRADVVFESKTQYTMWGQTSQDYQTTPAIPVGIGQTECTAYQSTYYDIVFEFQVSPFGNGPLILSNWQWTKFDLNIENAWGEKGDWSPFLNCDFTPIVIHPYFAWISQTSPQILNEWTNGMPKMQKDALCPYSPGGGLRPTVNLKFGPTPNYPATELPVDFWQGGVFWWWYNIGSTRASQLSVSNYYRSVGNAIYGPYYYAYSQLGMGINTTSPPTPRIRAPTRTARISGSTITTPSRLGKATAHARGWRLSIPHLQALTVRQ